MEKRISKRIEQYQLDFKNAIKSYLDKNGCRVSNEKEDITSDFLKFVFDFENMTLSKDDFRKRKRVKNQVPHYERCTARRANGEQCTRRRKDSACFCGTHIKGTPHGVVDSDGESKTFKKIEVWIQEIKGINYYIDDSNNVYLPEDILQNSTAPRKIGLWSMTDTGEYKIPVLGV
jgi:hypothetical protein